MTDLSFFLSLNLFHCVSMIFCHTFNGNGNNGNIVLTVSCRKSYHTPPPFTLELQWFKTCPVTG